jgi:putative transcriptional regulator
MNVREIRKLSGLNVRQFTEKYKIPYTTFHDWDTGKSNPPVYVLELLERAVREDCQKGDLNMSENESYYFNKYNIVKDTDCKTCDGTGCCSTCMYRKVNPNFVNDYCLLSHKRKGNS